MSLTDIKIPELMYAYADSRPDKVIDYISPSQVGRCMRAHFFAIKHIKQTTPPSNAAMLNFQVGFLWEEVMAKALDQAGIPYLSQYYMLDEELGVAGTLDFAPFDPETGEWEVWDSKTESLLASKYRNKDGVTFFSKHPEYVHQLNTYAILMRRQGFNVVRGRFGVIVKDNGLISENRTGLSDESLENTFERITQLQQYLNNDELPPCECEGWKVGYCGYGDPDTLIKNKTGKTVNSTCCGEELYESTSES